MHFDAVEHRDGIVFLHAVAEGAANRSYGLQVAKLAGVPAETIRQATAYLSRLDQIHGTQAEHQDDLFAAEAQATAQRPSMRVRSRCSTVLPTLDPDALAPRDAHAALYALKRLAE